MRMHKILFLVVIVGFLSFLFVSRAWAVGMEVTCGSGGCSLSSTDPLFSETNIYPTWSITKTIKAKNNYSEARGFAVEVRGASFSDSTPSLGDVLTITITEQESSTIVYGPQTVNQWRVDGFVVLSTVPTGGERNYALSVSLADVGNGYQGKTLGFDLNFGFESLPPGEEGSVLGVTTAAVLPATGKVVLGLSFLATLSLAFGLLLRRFRWSS